MMYFNIGQLLVVIPHPAVPVGLVSIWTQEIEKNMCFIMSLWYI